MKKPENSCRNLVKNRTKKHQPNPHQDQLSNAPQQSPDLPYSVSQLDKLALACS